MKLNFLCFMCLLMLVSFCVKTPNPPIITDQDKCQDACDNLNKLGCEEGKPVETGKICEKDSDCDEKEMCFLESNICVISCVDFCIITENNGVWLDPKCVSEITECNQIDQCPFSK